MSIFTELDSAAEKVFHDVEHGVAEVDTDAMADARRLLAAARQAESRLPGLVRGYEAEIVARAKQVLADLPPGVRAELEQALQAECTKLLTSLLALFGVAVSSAESE